jgi:C1A family cysteine protease
MFSTTKLMAYSDGVITNKYLDCSDPKEEVNHGVTLVGYGKVTDLHVKSHCKEDYWIIRNSWGRTWGDKGFFKLCADGAFSDETPYGTCHVNKYGAWPTVQP